jgi:ribosomal protein L11 methylase PrmA
VKRILKDLDVKLQEKELIDIGCGKGRVLIVAAETGFTKLRGIEIARELCDSALENIGLIKNKFPNAHFVIEHLNAIDYTPSPDAGVFFLFNPFPEKVMVKVAERISEHCKNYPESRIIYVNPKFAACFLEKGFTIEKEMRSKKYSEAIILRMK